MKIIKLLLVILIALAFTTAFSQERIITAGSALTETVCALGDCDKIIASDRTSLYPAQIQKLPSIGYRSGISAEGILSLKPTLMIVEKDYIDEGVLTQLASTQIRMLVIKRGNNFDDTRRFISEIAAALGREEEGRKLIARNEAELAEATALLKRTANRPKVLCVYNRGTTTVSLAGNNTFADIIPFAGGRNAFADEEGYKSLNPEALVASDPEYIVMLSSGFESLGGMEGVMKIQGIAQTRAGRNKQIISVDALRLTNFGPRFGETVKELVLRLHPDLSSN